MHHFLFTLIFLLGSSVNFVSAATNNFTFLSFRSLNLSEKFVSSCGLVTEVFELFQPDMWLSTIDPSDYHININCVPDNYTQTIQNSLESFRWTSFSVKVVGPCYDSQCGTGHLEVCLDQESQVIVKNIVIQIVQTIKILSIHYRLASV